MASVDNKHDVESASATKYPLGVDSNSNRSADEQAAGVAEGTVHVIDHIAEKKLCWKFDIRLMPVLALMCNPPLDTFVALVC